MAVYSVVDEQGSLQYVGVEVEEVVASIAPLLKKALKHAKGEIDLWSVLEHIKNEHMQLWIGRVDGEVQIVVVTEIQQYPLKRVVRLVAVAGKVQPFMEMWERIQGWAVMNGAVEIEVWCRPAVTRLLRRLNFKKVHDIVRLDLRRKMQ